MRKIIMVSAGAILAAISFSNLARAESGPWYNGFQMDSCKKMPNQAGCYGFEGMSSQTQPTTAVPAKKRGQR